VEREAGYGGISHMDGDYINQGYEAAWKDVGREDESYEKNK